MNWQDAAMAIVGMYVCFVIGAVLGYKKRQIDDAVESFLEKTDIEGQNGS